MNVQQVIFSKKKVEFLFLFFLGQGQKTCAGYDLLATFLRETPQVPKKETELTHRAPPSLSLPAISNRGGREGGRRMRETKTGPMI